MFLVIKLGSDFKFIKYNSGQGPWNGTLYVPRLGTSGFTLGAIVCTIAKIDVDESFAEAHLNADRKARTEKQEKKEGSPEGLIFGCIYEPGL